MKNFILTMTFVLLTTAGFAQDEAFKQDAVKYIEMSGQAKSFEMLTENLVSSIPAEKQTEFKKELKTSLNDLTGRMAEMYMEEFTHDDIKAFIKFYESPAGKKLTEKTEVLYEKGQAVGQEWGMGLQGMMMKYME